MLEFQEEPLSGRWMYVFYTITGMSCLALSVCVSCVSDRRQRKCFIPVAVSVSCGSSASLLARAHGLGNYLQ